MTNKPIPLFDALDFLAQAAMRKHRVEWDKAPPSQGDPGGYSYIKKACPAVIPGPWNASIMRVEDERCTCPAKEHNLKVLACRERLAGVCHQILR